MIDLEIETNIKSALFPTLSLSLSHTHILALFLTLPLSLSHTQTLSHNLFHSLSHTHSLSQNHTYKQHTLTSTHKITNTLSHSHTLTQRSHTTHIHTTNTHTHLHNTHTYTHSLTQRERWEKVDIDVTLLYRWAVVSTGSESWLTRAGIRRSNARQCCNTFVIRKLS